MPKVSEIEINLREYGFGVMRQKVFFTPRNDGEFYIPIPDQIKGAINQGYGRVCKGGKVTGKTLQEVKGNFSDMLDEYKKKMTSRKKVILYEISTTRVERDPERIKEDEDQQKKEKAVDGDMEIEIKFDVVYAAKFKDETDYFSIGKYAQDISAYDKKVIAWTPAREKFFIELTKRMAGLICKIDDFFEDDKRLLKAIDSGQKLLTS